MTMLRARTAHSALERVSSAHYESRYPWNDERPHVLVVACSDGRLQENLDDFLKGHLDIQRYDRFGFGFDNPNVRLSVYRCEVTADSKIQFVRMQVI